MFRALQSYLSNRWTRKDQNYLYIDSTVIDHSEEKKLKSKVTAVDIFCGCGGLSQGFTKAGFDVLLGVDCDPWAIETYNRHHKNRGVMKDITDVDAKFIYSQTGQEKIDILIGGPPCQAFSSVGIAKWRSLGRPGTLDHPLNNLYREFLRLVKEIKPSFFLIENVERMLSISEGTVKKAIESELNETYCVNFYRKDAADFGVPQHRKRAIIIGNKLGIRNPELDPTHGESPADRKRHISLKDAISDLPSIRVGGGMPFMKYTKNHEISGYAKKRRAKSPGIFNHISRDHNSRDIKIFNMLKPGQTSKDLPTGIIPYRNDIFTDKYKKQKWDSPSTTIMAHLSKDGLMYIHPDRTQSRTLTPREAARLQSFDDSFVFEGYQTHQFRQIGNAVPPLFAHFIAKKIKRSIQSAGCLR